MTGWLSRIFKTRDLIRIVGRRQTETNIRLTQIEAKIDAILETCRLLAEEARQRGETQAAAIAGFGREVGSRADAADRQASDQARALAEAIGRVEAAQGRLGEVAQRSEQRTESLQVDAQKMHEGHAHVVGEVNRARLDLAALVQATFQTREELVRAFFDTSKEARRAGERSLLGASALILDTQHAAFDRLNEELAALRPGPPDRPQA